MEFTFFTFSLTPFDILVFYLVGIFVGMSKTGVHGSGMLAVPLLANVFGGQLSSGILLPILCIADVIGVWYYHRHASWPYLRRLFPWAAGGIIAGSVMGEIINDKVFVLIMAVVIIISVALMIWLERSEKKVPDNIWFSRVTGIAGGFTSMIGNLAGSVMAVYFLSKRLPKNVFIGTTAWFFLVINLFKVPFHIFHWKTITMNTFLMDLTSVPAILIGAFLGIAIVRRLKEKIYRWFLITMTLLAAVLMLI